MDTPAKFYDNMGSPETTFRPEKKLAHDRALEIGVKRKQFVPSLSETYFGLGAKINAVLPNMGKVSISEERHIGKTLSDLRAHELKGRRKLTSSSEKYKFF